MDAHSHVGIPTDPTLLKVRDLYLILSDNTKFKSRKSLQFVPSYEGLGMDDFANGFPSVENPESQVMEILISKKAFLEVFVQCTTFIKENFLENDREAETKSHQELMWNQYLATLGLLLVTPENQTNILMHAKCIDDLFLSGISEGDDPNGREFTYIRTLLTSDLAKTNKSSTLWTYFRQLTLKTMENAYAKEKREFIWHTCITTVLDSVVSHPRNYYAWNYLRWLIKSMISHHDVAYIRAKLVPRIEVYCFANVNDATSWLFLSDLISFQVAEIYPYDDRKEAGDEADGEDLFSSAEILSMVKRYVTWVTDSETTAYSPWYSIVLLVVHLLREDKRESIHREIAELIEIEVHRRFRDFEKSSNALIVLDPCGIKMVYLNELGVVDGDSVKIEVSEKYGSSDVLLMSKIIIMANLKKAYTLFKVFDRKKLDG